MPEARRRSDAASGPRRAEILARATEIFAEKGYEAASFREIGEAVGAAKGNVTYYFAVKDDLLYEVVISLHRGFVALADGWASATGTPEENLRAAVREHVLLVCRSTAATKVAYESFRALTPDRRDEVVRLRDRYEAGLRAVVAAAAPAGTKPAEVALTTRLLLGSINWPYQWYRPGGRVTPEALADRAAAAALAMVAG